MAKNQHYIIGIAGGSASGKTTFINRLRDQFSTDQLCVISQDNYYKSLSDQQVDHNGEVNFDLPEAIDFKRLIKDVRNLAKGNEVRMIEYTFNNPGAFPKELVFKSAPIIIIEGLFIYTDKKLSDLFDLKVFIEARTDIMFARRLKRDRNERGIPEEMIRYQWNEHFIPAYQEHMMPHRDSVDMIVVNNDHFDNSFNVFSDHLKQILSTENTADSSS